MKIQVAEVSYTYHWMEVPEVCVCGGSLDNPVGEYLNYEAYTGDIVEYDPDGADKEKMSFEPAFIHEDFTEAGTGFLIGLLCPSCGVRVFQNQLKHVPSPDFAQRVKERAYVKG